MERGVVVTPDPDLEGDEEVSLVGRSGTGFELLRPYFTAHRSRVRMGLVNPLNEEGAAQLIVLGRRGKKGYLPAVFVIGQRVVLEGQLNGSPSEIEFDYSEDSYSEATRLNINDLLREADYTNSIGVF